VARATSQCGVPRLSGDLPTGSRLGSSARARKNPEDRPPHPPHHAASRSSGIRARAVLMASERELLRSLAATVGRHVPERRDILARGRRW